MPLKKGKSRNVVSANIRELHKGPQYRRTERKFGKAKADKQAVAVAMHEAGMGMQREGDMPRRMMMG